MRVATILYRNSKGPRTIAGVISSVTLPNGNIEILHDDPDAGRCLTTLWFTGGNIRRCDLV